MGNKNSAPKSTNQDLIQQPAYQTSTNFQYDNDQPAYQTFPTFKYDDDEPIIDQQSTHLPITSQQSEPEDINLEAVVKLSLRLKKKVVQSSSFSDQTFPMLVSLNVENLKSSKKAPIDLVCVIDHSGSMSGEKIELVKKTFDYLLNYLGDSDRLSIVIFDDQASRLVPLKRTTQENKQHILSQLQSVHGNGGTDINLGMQHAFQIIKQRRYTNPVTSIFLLSDGLDTGAEHKVRATLDQAQINADVTINTFGFGSDHDPQLMNGIADLRDGSFYFIKQLDTVDEAFIDCLGGLLSVIAQNVQIKIQPESSELLPGVEIVKAYGDAAMWQYNNKTYTTKMAALITGRQKDFVLELKVPINKKNLLDHQKDVIVASAEAEITGLGGQKVIKKTDLHITLLNETEEIKEEEEEDDREVIKNFYRVKGASLMDEARKLADQHKNDEAKKILQNFKEELVNSFLKEEEFIKNLIKDIEKAIENVNPIVYEQVGKHAMISNVKAQMYQRSNFESDNCYQNEMQSEMLKEVRVMKSKK